MTIEKARVRMLLPLALLAGSHSGFAFTGNFVIGGPASNLAPNSGSYSIDGSTMAGYVAAVMNAANFGPSGTVKTTVTVQPMSSITAGTLSGLNAFIAPWWYSSDSAPYNQLVVNYFLAGGNLILLNDSTNQNGISGILGIPTLGQADGSPEGGLAPIFIGPFGTATNVIQSAEIGYFSASAITSHGGSVCGVNTSGQPVVACFPAGAYAAGAGRLLIINDVDTWSTQASYSPLNSNGIFALNGTAFIIQGGALTPTPAPTPTGTPTPTPTTSVPTLSEWGMAALMVLLLASAIFAISRHRYQE